jgi:hypothetical protein
MSKGRRPLLSGLSSVGLSFVVHDIIVTSRAVFGKDLRKVWLVFFAAIFRVFPFLPTASACGFFFVAVPAPSWQFLFFGQSRSSSDRAGLVLSHFEAAFFFAFL